MSNLVIAIDGPAGAGKSDTAKALAKVLNLVHYNSGNSYRGITYALIAEGHVNEDLNSTEIKEFVNNLDITSNGTSIFLKGIDITSHLTTSQVNENVSTVAKHAHIRNRTNEILRNFIKSVPAVIVEGRDIGSVVLPNADIKIFLTASIETRAKRRMAQTDGSSFEEICYSISKRDEEDYKREISPLVCAEDAQMINNSELTLQETVDMIIKLL